MNNAKIIITVAGVALLGVSIAGVYREMGTSQPKSVTSVLSLSPASEAAAKGPFRFAPPPDARPLPGIRFTDAQGRPMTLADFRGKGVLLNLWATWCPPCRKEMPALERLQKRLGSSDFEVVALSVDKGGPFVVKEFFDELGIASLGIYIDETSNATGDLKAMGLPTTLLIDREGREIGRYVGAAEWDSPEIMATIQRHLKLDSPPTQSPMAAQR